MGWRWETQLNPQWVSIGSRQLSEQSLTGSSRHGWAEGEGSGSRNRTTLHLTNQCPVHCESPPPPSRDGHLIIKSQSTKPMVDAVRSMKEAESGGARQVRSQPGLGRVTLAETNNRTTNPHRWKVVWRGRVDRAIYGPYTDSLCRAVWPASR